MFKKMLKLGALTLSTVALVACGSNKSTAQNSLEKIQESGTLVVAVSPDYAPFEFQTLVDGKNTVVGADISLAQDIADELGVELKLSTMSFNNVLTSLKSGKADIAISGISYTEERAKAYDFSESYYDSYNVIMVKKDSVADYQALEDVAGKKLGVQIGSTQEVTAKAELSDANIVGLTTMGELVNELKSGQLDAVLISADVAAGFVAQNDDLDLSAIAIESSDEAYMAVAMQKDSPELKAAIDKVIEKVKGETYESYIAEAAKYTEIGEE